MIQSDLCIHPVIYGHQFVFSTVAYAKTNINLNWGTNVT